MSIFSFPRINFAGTIQLSPGTANNDDYAQAQGQLTMPASWGPFAGQPFGLFDSKAVQARTFGMPDEDFIAWVQQPQIFDGNPEPQMPSEWNYYGDMSSNATTTVVGVQTGPGQSVDASAPLWSLIGAPLTFHGGITDVNSEGSPPATQFFIDAMSLMNGATAAVTGMPSKGACQWINFYRNVNLTADGGAGGYIYHVLLAGEGTTIDIPGFPANARGLVLRYYLYNVQQGQGDATVLAGMYAQKQTNPATLQIVGSIAPLMPDEAILTGPVGRLMVSNPTPILTPPGVQNNAPNSNGPISLAPAVLQQDGNTISVDLLGTFPEYYQNGANPKYDFGPVALIVAGGGTTSTIGQVPYTNVDGGNALGWVFDFDISSNTAAQQALQDPDAVFSLVHPAYGTVLAETEYYFPSNQQAIYAEQHGPGDLFLNQGKTEPATVSVYRRGKLLPAPDCPPITVWAYQSTPIQGPGTAVVVSTSFKPGDRLVADTSQPGNILFTFIINDAGNPAPNGYPPQNYGPFSGPPWITNAPSISVRILPNDEDFSRYYVDSTAAEPVGNDQLTFDVVYARVLRTYYLLFPAMNRVFPLNSEKIVTAAAAGILERTEMSHWMTTRYMPRTRDLSASRRQLLR
ncbi:MAG TPA: hypothetical protein VE871_08150, partial [Longimicrobium sp.]|nr:hypothetical protein [Longimicrobium sp.]